MTDKPVCVSFAQTLGSRSYQEDFAVEKKCTLDNGEIAYIFAVFDGHGGDVVSKRCAELTTQYLTLHYADATQADLEAFVAMLHEQTVHEKAGTTMAIAVIQPRSRLVTTAVLGDSLVAVCSGDEVCFVTEEHNIGTNESERMRVMDLGALYDGTYMGRLGSRAGLQLTRALGDSEFDAYLSREPSVVTQQLPKNATVFICSDGFVGFYSFTPHEVFELAVDGLDSDDGAAMLMRKIPRLLHGDFIDNTTLFVVHIP